MLSPRHIAVVRALTIGDGGLWPSETPLQVTKPKNSCVAWYATKHTAPVNIQPPAVMTTAPNSPSTVPKMVRKARLPKPLPLTGRSGIGSSGKPDAASVPASAEVDAAAVWVLLLLSAAWYVCQRFLPDVLASGCSSSSAETTAGLDRQLEPLSARLDR